MASAAEMSSSSKVTRTNSAKTNTTMATTTGLRTFQIPFNDAGTLMTVNITEPAGVKADNLNLVTWASSQILAGQIWSLGLKDSLRALQKQQRIVTPTDSTSAGPLAILEVGAGTALVGITAAAHVSEQIMGLPEPVFTDLEGIVPGIKANIDANVGTDGAALFQPGLRQAPIAGSLDWRTPDHIDCADGSRIESKRKARLMFAADVIYDEDHPELLEKVCVEWLERDEDAKFIICYPLRVAYLDHIRDLWTRFEAAGLKATQEGKKHGEVTNGDDEMEIEWVVWQWNEAMLEA